MKRRPPATPGDDRHIPISRSITATAADYCRICCGGVAIGIDIVHPHHRHRRDDEEEMRPHRPDHNHHYRRPHSLVVIAVDRKKRRSSKAPAQLALSDEEASELMNAKCHPTFDRIRGGRTIYMNILAKSIVELLQADGGSSPSLSAITKIMEQVKKDELQGSVNPLSRYGCVKGMSARYSSVRGLSARYGCVQALARYFDYLAQANGDESSKVAHRGRTNPPGNPVEPPATATLSLPPDIDITTTTQSGARSTSSSRRRSRRRAVSLAPRPWTIGEIFSPKALTQLWRDIVASPPPTVEHSRK